MTEQDLLWTNLDWLAEAGSWIETELKRRGLELSGPVEQLHIRPWSTVLQVPTRAGHYYFKAVVPTLVYEAGLTEALARWQPAWMPLVMAVDPVRGWLLLAEGGQRLREVVKADGDLSRWDRILPGYALLQIEAANHLEWLLALGLPDRRLATLPAHFEQLLTTITTSPAPEPGEGLTATESGRLSDSVDRVAELAVELAAFGLPESLDHGDLHDANIFVQNGRYLFFDWGDSSVTHPFFSLRSTFVSLEYHFNLAEDSPWFERLRDRYLQSWIAYGTGTDLVAAFNQSRRLAPLTAALRWQAALSSLPAPERSDYAHAIPSLLREFMELNDIL